MKRTPWRASTATPAVVALAVWAVWLAALGGDGAGRVLKGDWPITLTMVFGSFVAGASSEGGGAVAFPVFTKCLGVAPADAKLFALAIQSLGMTAAALTIGVLRVRVDHSAIVWASLGGAVGVATSLAFLAPGASPPHVRVLFTALQAGFAVVLVTNMLTRRGAETHPSDDSSSEPESRLKPITLLAAGLVGGMLSGLVGSGLDLVVFAVLALRWGVSERIATPTSVVIMAINSLIAIGWYRATTGEIPSQVASMWLAAAPVVVVGAPLGAWVCSKLSRDTIAWSLVGLITIEVATTCWLVPVDPSAAALGGVVWLAALAVCFLMTQRRRFDTRQQSSSR